MSTELKNPQRWIGEEFFSEHHQGTAHYLDINVMSTVNRSSLSRPESRGLAEQRPHVLALAPTPPSRRSEDGSYYFSDITTPSPLNQDNVSLGSLIEPFNNSKVLVKDPIPLTATGNANYPKKSILCRPERKNTTENNILGNSSAKVYEESIEDKDIVSAENDEGEASGEITSNARRKDEKHDEHKEEPATDKDVSAAIIETDNNILEGKHVGKTWPYT